MQSPEIRPAQPADLEAISKIERENFSFPWHYADFARMCGEKEKLLLCASSEAGCLGYIGAYLLPDGAEIMTVAVDAAARGRGIGKKLVLAALRTLQDHGVPAVHLEVRAGNAAARALYEGCGFIFCGVRRGYYKRPPEDAALYRYDFPGASNFT